MANDLEPFNTGNFSIIDTSDSLGNPNLLNSIFEEEVIKVDEEEKKKPAAPKKEEPKKDEKKPPLKDPNKALKTFLTDEEEEEEEGTDEPENKDDKPSKKDEKSEEEGEEEEQDKTVNPFTSLSKDLFELGVFSKAEGEEDVEIKTPEEFLERFNFEKKKGANAELVNFLGQFGDDYQEAFQAIYVKGVDPREYFTTYNQIEDIASLDLKVEENQIAIIKQALIEQEFEAADIPQEIERLKNYGDLETVATRYQKTLIKKQATKLENLEKESAARVQAEKAQKAQYIKNVQTVLQDKVKAKEFDGIPLNPQLATELQDFLITDKYKSKSGELLTEFDLTILNLKKPENHSKKVKVALLIKLLEKDPTLSTILNTAVSKKTNQLFGEVARLSNKKSSVKEQSKENTKSWFS